MEDISRDFDFIFGKWKVLHRRLRARLVNSNDWEVFEGHSSTTPVLGGNGNIEDNVLNISTGSYRAIAVRSFDSTKKSWAIWWLDGRAPHHLDVPVIGKFEAGIGRFYAQDSMNGLPIRVRFLWLTSETDNPRWEQAMSLDDGVSWETNWTMDFMRV